MTTPLLSAPILFTPSELQSNPTLEKQIVDLVNDAFTRAKIPNPEKWILPSARFPNVESLHSMLSPESVMALIFDDSESRDKKKTNGTIRSRKIVACAAAVPWLGGWEREGAGTEKGWEIKAVCVDGDAKYLRQGLAVRLLACLENYVIANTRRCLMDQALQDTTIKTRGLASALTLWILTAECIAGPYWRKRGYQEMRRKAYGKGVWGCQTNFEMVVMRKEVYFVVEP